MDTTCHFLRVPPEIRLNIYRYLLFEPPRASLDPSYPEKAFNIMMDQKSACDNIDHSFVQENDDPNSDDGGTVMYNHLILDQPPPWWERRSPAPMVDEEEFEKTRVAQEQKSISERKQKFEDEYIVRRYPAILGTNRQIHNEASALLYSSIVMEVRPGDLIWSNAWGGIVELNNGVWRSFPWYSRAKSRFGHSKPLAGGLMEPRTFAKFEKVSFVADLNFIVKDDEPQGLTFFVDDNFRTSREDDDNFVAYLNGKDSKRRPVSDIFGHFVEVLHRSPRINRLNVSISVKVDVAFDIDSEDEKDDGEEEEEEDSDGSETQDEKEDMKIIAANLRAIELVLEAGVLDPLKRISNAKSFGLSFALLQDHDKVFKTKPEHAEIIQGLKETIQGNFVAKKRVS